MSHHAWRNSTVLLLGAVLCGSLVGARSDCAPVGGASAPGLEDGVPGVTAHTGQGDLSGALTLDGAFQYAFEHNPRIAGAEAAIREARARGSQRKAERLPQVGVNNFVLRQGPVIPSPGGGPPAVPPYRYNVGIFFSQAIFDWGQRAAQQRQAARETDATRLRSLETRNQVRLVVAASFYNILRAEQLVVVARDRVAAATEQLRVARARFEQNISPRFDVLRGEAELANAEQELIAAQNEREITAAALNTAMGRDVRAPVILASPPERPVPPVPLKVALESATSTRPELVALAREVDARKLDVRARQAEGRPHVNVTGAYDRPNPGGFAPQSFRYNFGLVMTYPVFDGGLVRGRVREAQAGVERNRQALEGFRQQVELDARQSLLDMEEARLRTGAATKELESAREALRVANVRYRAGLGTNVEVTDAQVAVARAGQNQANARFDFRIAVARLEAATGLTVEQLLERAPASERSAGTGVGGSLSSAGVPAAIPGSRDRALVDPPASAPSPALLPATEEGRSQ